MAYWQRARRFASEHSKMFALWKAIPAILSAVVSFILRLQIMQQALVTIITAIGCYLLLYGAEFLWRLLIQAPLVIEGERQNEIKQLNAQIESLSRKPYDEAFERMVREKVQKASQPAKELLKFMLDHGEMDISHVRIATGNQGTVGNECYSLGFLDKRELRPGNGTEVMATYYKLKEQFHPVLKEMFYPKSS